MIYGTLIKEGFGDINIPPEQIQNLIESFQDVQIEDMLLEGDMKDFITAEFKLVPNAIVKITRCAEDIVKTIKWEGISKESIDEIIVRINKMWDDLASGFDPVTILDYEGASKYDPNKLIKATTLLFWVFAFNSLFSITLNLLFGRAGYLIFVCLIAPIMEESAKQISIRGKFQAEFAFVFNVFEFTNYITSVKQQAKIAGGKVVKSDFMKYVGVRLSVVVMHISTTFIQWLTQNPKIQKMLNIDSKEDKAKAAAIGQLIGILIHASWNFVGRNGMQVNVTRK